MTEQTWDEFIATVRSATGPAVFVRNGVRLLVDPTKNKMKTIGPVMREIGPALLNHWPSNYVVTGFARASGVRCPICSSAYVECLYTEGKPGYSNPLPCRCGKCCNQWNEDPTTFPKGN